MHIAGSKTPDTCPLQATKVWLGHYLVQVATAPKRNDQKDVGIHQPTGNMGLVDHGMERYNPTNPFWVDQNPWQETL